MTQPPDEKQALSAMLRGRRVLIVEDESMVIMLLEDMLSAFGCQVIGVATTLKDGLAAIEHGPVPDAVVLDLKLHGSHSYKLADALASRGVPFLIVTGYGEEAVAESYRQRPILRKPFLDDDLARALGGALNAATQSNRTRAAAR